MADESFRIVTQGGNFFIPGPDTPDGGWTKNNGVSTGTANGVYSFLEDELNVRWLKPGDLGRDVPAGSTLSLPKMDRTVTRRFSWRCVTHLWDYSNASQQRSIAEWSEHQRLGGAANYKLNPGKNTLVVQVTSKNDNSASGILKGAAIVAGTCKEK